MPIFEFKCTSCTHIFERLFVASDEEANLSCPECKATSLERVVSRTNYAMGVSPGGKQPKITTKSCGGSNKCMTLDLPGPSKD